METLQEELTLRAEIFEKFTADGAAIEVQRDEIITELDSSELGPEEAAARQLQVVELNERLAQEKRKAQLAFQSAKATRAEIQVIESKLKKDTTALAKLLGEDSQDLAEEYTPAVADKPEMLGVNEFAESAIIIRFVIKTVADMRLPVRREMLRRIKNRFDKEGISIPYPHRVVVQAKD